MARKQILNAVGALLDEEESFYPLLALESYARDEAVSRLLREMARQARTDGKKAFGARRRGRQFDRVLEYYLAGEFGPAVEMLARVVPLPEKGAPTGPAAEALAWAVETADRRPLQPEEFLLALFAVRRLLTQVGER